MNIYDIAEKSGVSIATVSRVINGSNTVRPQTRDKVLRIIEAENYHPNALARGLSTSSARLAGVLCTDISDPFFSKGVGILQELLTERGYTMLLGCTGNSPASRKTSLEFILEKQVDIIFLLGSAFGSHDDTPYLKEISPEIPVVMINATSNSQNTYSVYCDDESAVAKGVDLLCKSGCKNIMYIYDSTTPSGIAKLSGYSKGLSQNSLPYNDALVLKVPKTLEGGKGAVVTALSRGEKIDGVIASEDILAVGALKELCGTGVKVIGYNNSSLCECTTPALSSIDNRLEEMCRKSAELMDCIFKGEKPEKNHKFTANLVIR